MPDAFDGDLSRYRAAIIAALPQFVGGNFVLLTAGWDSLALECDGWIFKFPRNAEAERRLRREAVLLAFLRPRVTMTLPQMQMHDGPQPFSQHRKIPGEMLDSVDYDLLDDGRRNALALRMAQLYAELHALPPGRMQSVGAVAVDPWMAPDDILADAEPRLPRQLLPFLKRTVKAYRKLKIAPEELVFGYFDGHGWNMAFDPVTGLLNGVYDFADSGLGARHRDLSYSNWVSPDLTLRIIARYEELTRRAVNRDLVMLYTSALRLAELAKGDLDIDVALDNVVRWARYIDPPKAKKPLRQAA